MVMIDKKRNKRNKRNKRKKKNKKNKKNLKKNNFWENKMSKLGYQYNLRISRLPTHKLNYLELAKVSQLPDKVDLRAKMPPIYDQGQLGSCTANALAALVEFLDGLMGSRLFIYYNERKIENDVADDGGAQLSDGIKSLETYGVCLESDWPYDINKFTQEPSTICYKKALQYRVYQAKNISNTINDMKNTLASGYPFCVGIQVFSSFESDTVAKTGIVPLPTSTDQNLGGHAIVCVGYDNTQQHWIMRNSWGPNWGDSGYFYLPYSYLTDTSLSTDLWSITKLIQPQPQPQPQPEPKPEPEPEPEDDSGSGSETDSDEDDSWD